MRKLTGSLDIVPVVDGEKGEAAVMYQLEATPAVLNLDAGRAMAVSCRVAAYRVKGSERTLFDGGTLLVQGYRSTGTMAYQTVYSGSSCTFSSSLGSNSCVRFVVRLQVDGADLATVTVPVLLSGKRSRMCGYWDSGRTYYDTDEVCDSVVMAFADGSEQAYDRKGGGTVSGEAYAPNTAKGSSYWNPVESNPKEYFRQLLTMLITANQGDFNYLNAMYCHFREVTVEGVLNNLVQTVTAANRGDFGSSGSSGILLLDPLKAGAVLQLSEDCGITAIELPYAYWDGSTLNGGTVSGCHASGEKYTMNDMRQCVGKRIHILQHQDSNTRLILRCGYQEGTKTLALLLWRSRLMNGTLDLLSLPQGTAYPVTEQVQRMYEWQPGDGYHFFVLECRMGRYNGTECIYWELEAAATGGVLYD